MRWPPDLAELAVALGLRLRRAGVVVGLMGIEAFARGLAACPPDSLDSPVLGGPSDTREACGGPGSL